MNNTNYNDTIAAITTPTGTAGVSIIRLSGSEAWNIALKLFRGQNKEPLKNIRQSRFYYGWIINPENDNLIDEAIILVFKSPKSYTTEDVIEIQCHGGISVTRRILDLCVKQGARIAEKGEFTKRAFLGGRIDLTQVEAVLDIISARTELFSSVAAYNLSGKLSDHINKIRTQLINLLAHIHASLDFPDEVDEMAYQELISDLNSIKETIENVLTRATDGTILKHGIKAALIGKPNVGKSSLFNYLLNADRAIVTNIPGTTRDIIQEYIDIDGIPVILTDTAGIRETLTSTSNDYIESIGVNRSRGAMQDSDIIIFIYDITQGITEEDKDILEDAKKFNKPVIKSANKLDKSSSSTTCSPEDIALSAITGQGIKELKNKIKNTALGEDFKPRQDEVYINVRHKECLENALRHINLSINASKNNVMQDLISIDIKAALLALDEVVGEVVSENIIDHIFSQFCVGK